jgi:hypothetical protein
MGQAWHARARRIWLVHSGWHSDWNGIAIATMASPGQGTLQVSSELATDGLMGVAVIRSEATGAALKYMISESWMPRLINLNKTKDP